MPKTFAHRLRRTSAPLPWHRSIPSMIAIGDRSPPIANAIAVSLRKAIAAGADVLDRWRNATFA
jgi:hypothetical protein